MSILCYLLFVYLYMFQLFQIHMLHYSAVNSSLLYPDMLYTALVLNMHQIADSVLLSL